MQMQSSDMSNHTDVLIVGGGVIGVCIAHYLSQQDLRVTLLERGDIASGCSYGNAGWVVPSHSIPLATPAAVRSGLKWMFNPASPFYIKPRPSADLVAWLLRFARAANPSAIQRAVPVLRDLSLASRALYDELAQSAGFDFDYRQQGMLQVCKTAYGYAAAQLEARELCDFGLKVKVLDRAEMSEREPLLRPDVEGGLYFPDDAHLNPADFVHGMARLAKSRGVMIRTGVEVLGFEVSANRITRTRTTAGDLIADLIADHVVLAAGSWSHQLAHDLRLRLPMQPGKGYSVGSSRVDLQACKLEYSIVSPK